MAGARPTVDEVKDLLGLEPLPVEGGFFSETYRATEAAAANALPARYGGARSFGTAIYYLVTPERFSSLHRLASDEVFHFYLGDPVEMLQLHPSGAGSLHLLGSDLAAGQRPQVVVPRGTWQGCRLVPGGRLALLGCTVAPGFDVRDYEHGDREALLQAFPAFADGIRRMTREE